MPRPVDRLGFIEPQLLTLTEHPPRGSDWIHEIKHDGYRCQVLLERGQARVFTRNGHDWSDRYPSIVRAAANLRCQSAILDGEAIVQDDNGISDFEALPSAMRWRPDSIILYAFDLMHLDGRDLRQQCLSERRSILKALIGNDDESRIQLSDEFHGDGDALFKACAQHGLEGIVSKHALAPYRSGRSRTWLKTKCFSESTFVVIGTDRDRKTGALRALLAHPGSAGLNYAGAAFIALSDDARTEFIAEVGRLTTSWAAFKSSRLTDVKWCQPKLIVRVKHLAGSKMLRHATVRALAQ
ncbi:MAG: non-homologous end-joining DNA ligase [Methyloceanibacter sp.]|nr:non-homologous end-joining DNA ligase [Methyloceanibacter sp.]